MSAPSLPDAILDAMEADGRLAVPVAHLVEATGGDEDAIDRAIGGLLDGEEIESWDHPSRGLCLVFKAITAERRGLVIASRGLRWVRKGTPRSKRENQLGARKYEARASDAFGEYALEVLANHVDPGALDPALRLMANEVQVRQKADVFPIRLLGLGLTWPVVIEEGEPCPGCGDRRLTPNEFCLICDAPIGGLVYRARAAVRRREAGRKERLNCGTGRVSA